WKLATDSRYDIPGGRPRSARTEARSRSVADSKNRSSAAFGTYASRPRHSGKASRRRSVLKRETDRIRSAPEKARSRSALRRGDPKRRSWSTSWLVTALFAERVGTEYSAGQ